MSVRVMAGVWKTSTAKTPAELLVLLALADWADDYGYCYPSAAGIASKALVSERQVQRVVRKFTDLGELEREIGGHATSAPGHRPGKTGLQRRNLYRLTCVPNEERGDTTSPLLTRRGDIDDIEGVTPATSPNRSYVRQVRTRQVRTRGRSKSSEQEIPPPTNGTVYKGGDISVRKKKKPSRHDTHVFCGQRFCVCEWLHEKFQKQLGGERDKFELPGPNGYYAKIDQESDEPIAGKVEWWLENRFVKDLQAEFGT